MSDFYGTVIGFQGYTTLRNIDYGTPTDEEIGAALVVASEWIDAVYRSMFPGLKVDGRDQVREWPRSGATDIYGYPISSTTPPTEVESATYEATIRQLAIPGSLSTDYTPNKYRRAQVEGAVNVEYRSFDSAMEAQTRLMIVDQILAPVLSNQNTGTSVAGYALRG